MTNAICASTGLASVVPQTKPDGLSAFFTKPASTGSVTAVNNSGLVKPAFTWAPNNAFEAPVPIPKLMSQLSTKFLAKVIKSASLPPALL